MVAFETVFTVSSSGLRLAVASEVISNLGVQAILVIQVLLLFKLNHDDSKLRVERKYMIFCYLSITSHLKPEISTTCC